MFDIHYHLLFGLDDGPESIEGSVNLAEASLAEGVTHIVCTPHSNDRYRFDPHVNRERMEILQEAIGPRLTLGLGCDFHLSYENIEDLQTDQRRYTINESQYLLVEFPDFGIAPNMTEAFQQMKGAGLVPIITHPERNPTLLSDPQRLFEWIRGGCLVQVTAASLTGRFGRHSEAMANQLVNNNWAHLIASDAHSVERRPPAMRGAYDHLQKRFGTEVAERLCVQNPRAVFFGQQMPLQPEPEGRLGQHREGKGGFLSRLFSR